MINKKEQIIDYFKSGIREKKKFKIGIEHEKFLFDLNNNQRIDYSKIKEMFSTLAEFGWKPIYEKDNIVGLNKGGKNKNQREKYKDHKYYQDAIDFCEKWDQASFDPNYESLPLEKFAPMVKNIFSRKPYSLLNNN